VVDYGSERVKMDTAGVITGTSMGTGGGGVGGPANVSWKHCLAGRSIRRCA